MNSQSARVYPRRDPRPAPHGDDRPEDRGRDRDLGARVKDRKNRGEERGADLVVVDKQADL
jgi:hypothetical protein